MRAYSCFKWMFSVRCLCFSLLFYLICFFLVSVSCGIFFQLFFVRMRAHIAIQKQSLNNSRKVVALRLQQSRISIVANYFSKQYGNSSAKSPTLEPPTTQVHVQTTKGPAHKTTQNTVFGSADVIIASSVNLSSWLSLSEMSCHVRARKAIKFRYLDVILVCKDIDKPCYVWYWDVANWTLTYTKEVMSTKTSNYSARFCPMPIHGERTAKIIRHHGKVDYPGCTIKKSPCAPFSIFAATFDHTLQQRINRSPCCRKLLVDITLHMGRVFDKYNITYFLVGGPVISLVRDNGVLIPYDTDTDVAVDVNDYNKIIKAIPELNKPGYIFKWNTKHDSGGQHWYMTGCTHKDCHTGPGIALYIKEGDNIYAPAPKWKYPAKITVPPIKGIFEGMAMGFPKKPKQYLDFNYGEDKWRTPLKCTQHYYDQCSE